MSVTEATTTATRPRYWVWALSILLVSWLVLSVSRLNTSTSTAGSNSSPAPPPGPQSGPRSASGGDSSSEVVAAQQAGIDGLHIHLVLDESGSMLTAVQSTISSINKFLLEQRTGHVIPDTVGGAGAKEGQPQQPPTPPPQQAQQQPPALPPQQAQQQQMDDCKVSVTKFSNGQTSSLILGRPLHEVPEFSSANYKPHGNTNLLDAIGHVIQLMDAELAKQPIVENRSGVLIVITTDGEENMSQRFTQSQIQEMIQERRKMGWTFVFLGANIDAWQKGQQYGIPQSHSFNYDTHSPDNLGTVSSATLRQRDMYNSASNSVSSHSADKKSAIAKVWSAMFNNGYFSDEERKKEYHYY